MRRLWECKDWSKYIDTNRRTGIRQRFDSGVDKEVRRACKEYIAWLRTQYDFPVRVPIYFKEREYIVTSKGEQCSALFFGPYDKSEEPYIKVAVGDYPKLLRECEDKDNALAANLYSITHELKTFIWMMIRNVNDRQYIMQEKLFWIMQRQESIRNMRKDF